MRDAVVDVYILVARSTDIGAHIAQRTYPFRTGPFPYRTSGSSSYFSRTLLHRRKLAQHLLRFREISGMLTGKSTRSAHLLKHSQFFSS